jgi:hypothetical protein
MKTETLQVIEPLLSVLRSYSALIEVRPTVFHHNGRDFIHFHEEPKGIFADVRLTRGQVRLPATTQADQAELLGVIEKTLLALETHSTRKRTGRRHEPNGDA